MNIDPQYLQREGEPHLSGRDAMEAVRADGLTLLIPEGRGYRRENVSALAREHYFPPRYEPKLY